MKVKDLKEAISKFSDDAEVILAGYNHKTGGSVFRYANMCCNTDHQIKKNEVWISTEGLIIQK